MADQYTVKKSVKLKTWDITKFDDGDMPSSTYHVTERSGFYSCDCPGYRRQKVKEDHKHSRIVKFWRENLEESPGYFLSISGSDIEYTKLNTEW